MGLVCACMPRADALVIFRAVSNTLQAVVSAFMCSVSLVYLTPSPMLLQFDSHFGFLKGGEDHMTQRSGDDGNFNGPDLWHGKVPGIGLNGTYSTYLYTAEAVRVVRAHPLPAPFFLYLPFQVSCLSSCGVTITITRRVFCSFLAGGPNVATSLCGGGVQVTHSPYEIPDGYVNSSTAPERQVINAMVAIMDEVRFRFPSLFRFRFSAGSALPWLLFGCCCVCARCAPALLRRVANAGQRWGTCRG